MTEITLVTTETVLELAQSYTVLVLETEDAPILQVVGQPEPILEIVEETVAVLVALAEQGPAGAQGERGPPGPGVQPLVFTAGTTVGVGLIVRCQADGTVVPASAMNTADADQAIGIATSAANAAGLLTIVPEGLVTEPTWSWTVGPLFLGPSGTLSATPPATGFLQQVAVAVSPTSIVLGLRPAILLT